MQGLCQLKKACNNHATNLLTSVLEKPKVVLPPHTIQFVFVQKTFLGVCRGQSFS
jgi:hypothetical protein